MAVLEGATRARVARRQRVRAALILLSFLLFPITLDFFSPYLVIASASQGLVNASLVVFAALFLSSLVLGRAWCGWACPGAGLQDWCALAVDRPVPGGTWNLLKWVIWVPWVALIAWLAVSAGGYRAFSVFGHDGVILSVARPGGIVMYYTVVGLFIVLSIAVGRRATCHYVCWMAPFMILGRKLRNRGLAGAASECGRRPLRRLRPLHAGLPDEPRRAPDGQGWDRRAERVRPLRHLRRQLRPARPPLQLQGRQVELGEWLGGPFRTSEAPGELGREGETVASVDDVLRQIEEAFAEAPRPRDDELLHERARDDGDIASLYGIPHWRGVPDDVVEREWAALAFLGSAGFRHFLPAYMSWVLRHPDGGAAVVGSTIYALAPVRDNPLLREFMLSKLELLDDAQRSAVVLFLEAMVDFEDVSDALELWRST